MTPDATHPRDRDARDPDRLLAVTTTVATMDDARRLADMLVARRLAACVQLEAIESTYVWHGAVQREPEVRLLGKTTAARYAALQAALLAEHPYELPAVYAVTVTDASVAYAAWVRDVVAQST